MKQTQIDIFLKMVESLRKYRRAELLNEENENIIEDLYTDPLDGNHILKTLLNPNTTLLIGRKGTGKSTIIGRFQHEIRKTDNQLSLYIDVKTIFEQAKAQGSQDGNYKNILSNDEIVKFMTYKKFLQKVLEEIKKEIKKDIFANRFTRVFTKKGTTKEEFEKQINKLFEEISTPQYEDITAIKEMRLESSKMDKNSIKSSVSGELSFSSPKVSSELEVESIGKEFNNEQFSTILQRCFSVIDFMEKIKKLLEKVGIKRVFICLDDASEIEEDSLDIFMRTIVAPLNNLADEYFKFKISFYPGRDITPNIDRTKVDTLKLDYYDLYLSSGTDKIEENAIKCTKRLLENRFKYFFDEDIDISEFFDTKKLSLEDYYKIIFQISSNIPRTIGRVLWYAAKRSINAGQKITKSILQESAKEYYINDIEIMLIKNEYMEYKTYDESFGREHLKRLVDLFIEKAKENKKQIGISKASIFENYTTNNAPSNYLFFPPEFEETIATLELNFFITKFSQQKDKDTREVSIYTLNYGLCQKENIIFDEKSDRKFRIERLFDYTKLITEWALSSEEIICSSCKAKHEIGELETIKKYGMRCPICFSGICKIERVEKIIPVSGKLKVSEEKFLILNTLRIENSLTSRQIGEELDMSAYSVGAFARSGRQLRQDGYLEKDGDDKYHITKKALSTFFS